MIRVIRNGVITNVGPDMEWFNRHSEMGSFGKPEHVVEVSPAEFDAEGNELHGAYYQTIPSEFTWEEFNPEQEQDHINSKARKYLADTDWYVVRQMETGVPVPQEVLTLRAGARAIIQ